jgi:hypothetical protein
VDHRIARTARELSIGLTSVYRKLEVSTRDFSRSALYSPSARTPDSPGADPPRRLG